MQALFANNYGTDSTGSADASKIIEHLTEIDAIISTYAPKWPIAKINQVDLAILRCAIWELKYHPETPQKVTIDEAIELAKEFGTESSPSFINGCLGGIIKSL